MINHNMMCRKIQKLGVEKSLSLKIINQVQNWEKNNGEEWTVNRLKLLKQAYVNILAGNRPEYPWIKYSKRSKLPSGPFGILFSTTSKKGKPSKKKVMRVLVTLNLYTLFLSQDLTQSQIAKFKTGLLDPPKADDKAVKFVIKDQVKFVECFNKEHLNVSKLVSSNRRDFSSLPHGETSVPVGTGARVKETDFVGWLPNHAKYLVEEGLHTHPTFSGFGSENLEKLAEQSDQVSQTVGAIGFIQEPGFKLRSIANPNRLIQTALKPLQSALFYILRKMDADCTFDQSAGVSFVSEALKQGKTIYSIDLTSATDFFPLDIQISLLRELGLDKNAIDLFAIVSRKEWEFRDPGLGKREKHKNSSTITYDHLGPLDEPLVEHWVTNDYPLNAISWKKGQPMGLTPSFPSFALAHHSVVCAAGGDASNYRILGDDIVITNKQVADGYKHIMTYLGCPVSPSKTLESKKVGQFAGQTITRDWFLPSFKWRQISDRSFLDIARTLGPKSRSLLRPRQRVVFDFVKDIPEFAGGFGWNTDGVPLDIRLAKADVLSQQDRTVPIVDNAVRREYLSSYLRTLDINVDKHCPALPTRESYTTLETVMASCKMKSCNVLESFLDENPNTHLAMGKKDGDPRGPTTLQSLESKISSYNSDLNKIVIIDNIRKEIIDDARNKRNKLKSHGLSKPSRRRSR